MKIFSLIFFSRFTPLLLTSVLRVAEENFLMCILNWHLFILVGSYDTWLVICLVHMVRMKAIITDNCKGKAHEERVIMKKFSHLISPVSWEPFYLNVLSSQYNKHCSLNISNHCCTWGEMSLGYLAFNSRLLLARNYSPGTKICNPCVSITSQNAREIPQVLA